MSTVATIAAIRPGSTPTGVKNPGVSSNLLPIQLDATANKHPSIEHLGVHLPRAKGSTESAKTFTRKLPRVKIPDIHNTSNSIVIIAVNSRCEFLVRSRGKAILVAILDLELEFAKGEQSITIPEDSHRLWQAVETIDSGYCLGTVVQNQLVTAPQTIVDIVGVNNCCVKSPLKIAFEGKLHRIFTHKVNLTSAIVN